MCLLVHMFFKQTSKEHYVGMEAEELDQEKVSSKCRKWVSICTWISFNSPRCQSNDVKVNKFHTPGKTSKREWEDCLGNHWSRRKGLRVGL